MSPKPTIQPDIPTNMSTSPCRECRHLIIWPYCFAFMSGAGIPVEIREGRLDHTKPFPGDHDVRFLHKDSPYELSEDALKEVMASYKGQSVMPELDKPSEALRDGAPLKSPTNTSGRTVATNLIEACIAGDVESVRELLDRGADINSKDIHGNTPLMHACRNCHLELVELLLDRGCDTATKDKYSKRAIDIAEDWGYPTLVELLKSRSND